MIRSAGAGVASTRWIAFARDGVEAPLPANEDMEATITLYRPVGQKELDLIADSGYREFPPRLPDQPIFYRVLTLAYAEQIASQWNTKDERSAFIGHVVEFQVDESYLSRFEKKKVGASQHIEYWIPAEQLPELNRHILGDIRVIRTFTAPSR